MKKDWFTAGAVASMAIAFAACGSNTPASVAQSTTTTKAHAAVTTTTATTTTTLPPTTTTTVPPTTTTAPPPPTTAAPTPAVATSCSPTSAAGNCYHSGEYCSDADHGMTGTDGNGNAIVCTDNNGWRWEPA